MKLSIFIILLPIVSYSQKCDTLYSHENYVERTVEIEYRDCYSINLDSTYSIVQRNNFDPNYLRSYFLKTICYSLYNSITGGLIEERWQELDTVYFKRYYNSGRVKSTLKSVFRETPYYFHIQRTKYYENGKVQYKGESKSSSFSIHNSYYSDGALESHAIRFSYNQSPFGEYVEYFPNGQFSAIRNYSLPDTTTNQYQKSELISEKYFNEIGEETDTVLNEHKKMYIPIYPPVYVEELKIGTDLYTHQQFDSQDGYSNNMHALKRRIINGLKISNECHCKKGIAWVSLIINDKGKIDIQEIQFENESLKKSIENSIKTIKSWRAATINGKKVKTYIYTYLIIDQ